MEMKLEIPQGTKKDFSLVSLKNHLYLASLFQCPLGVIYILPHQNLKKKFDVLSFCKEFSLLEVVKFPPLLNYTTTYEIPLLFTSELFSYFLDKVNVWAFILFETKEHLLRVCCTAL